MAWGAPASRRCSGVWVLTGRPASSNRSYVGIGTAGRVDEAGPMSVHELLEKTRGFSAKVSEAVLNGQVEAVRLRQSVISTEHLLLGLLRVKDCLAPRILERLQVDPDQLRESVLARAPRGEGPLDAEEVKKAKLNPAA